MKKVTFGPKPLIVPMPVFLIGTTLNNTPNFLTASWCGIVNSEPPMAGIGIRYVRYSYNSIKENGTLSINVPSTPYVNEMDYCGMVSGRRRNKVSDCGFHVFYGKLKTAPLIEECPICLECSVVHELGLGTHALFVVRIEETYVSEACLTDGEPDVQKIQPIVYSRVGRKTYHAMGNVVGHTHSAGKELLLKSSG